MALVYNSNEKMWFGNSTDDVPTNLMKGDMAFFFDTGKNVRYNGAAFVDYVVNTDTTLYTGDLEIGAVELKDATTDTRAIIDADGNLHMMGMTVFDAGIATGGSKTTIVDTSKDYPNDLLIGKVAEVIVDGITYLRDITDNTNTTITINTLPGNEAYVNIGSGGNGTVTITAEQEDDLYNTHTVEVVAGNTENGALSAAMVDNDLVVTLGMGYGDNATTTIGSGDNGVVTPLVLVAGSAGNNYTIAVDASLATPDRALGSTLVGNDLTILLATEANAKANATMGTGDNGVVTIEVDAAGSGGNSYALSTNTVLTTQDRVLDTTLVGNDLTVVLATEGNAKANTNIGSGTNGTVAIEVDAAGTSGNDYTVVVDGALTTQDRALSASLAVKALSVLLATEGNAKATSSIGTGADGTVNIEVDAAGTDGNDYTVTVNADLTTQRALSASEATGDLLVNLATEGNAKANTTIGSGDNGVITIEVDAAGTNGNSYTIAVNDTVTSERVLDTTLVGSDLVVLLATEGSAKANTTIGSGDNGTVTVESDTAGTNGNAYTIAVDASLTTQDRALDTSLVGNNLVVLLATEGNASATTSVGSGDNGTVNVSVDAVGSNGNDYTITVNDSLTTQRALSAALVSDDLTVYLATEGDDKASVDIGSGVNGMVTAELDAAGTDGNAYTVVVDASLATQDRALSSTLVGTVLTVNLATEGDDPSTATIGSGDDGTVNLKIDAEGSDGDAYTVQVIAGAGALGVTCIAQALVVTLASGGSTAKAVAAAINLETSEVVATYTGNGESLITIAEAEKNFAGGTNKLKASSNTATLVAGSINDDTAGITASASGDGSASLTVAESSKSFSGGTNKVHTTANTATLVAGAINDGTAGLTASATGTGNDSLTAGEAQKNFANGTNQLKAASNTATLVTAEINTNHGATFTASASGDGSSSLTGAEVQKNFANGTNVVNTTTNTATLIAAEINTNHGSTFTATASGDGSTNLATPVVQKSFANGTNKVHTTANTATLVAGAINDGTTTLTATATGTGSSSLTIAEAQKNFTNGTNKLKSSSNTATLVATAINDGTVGLTATASGDGTASLTVAEVLKSFANGTNKLHTTANTASLIASEINTNHGATFTASASGDGSSNITPAITSQSFTGGTNKIHTTANTATLITARINGTHGALLSASASGTGVRNNC
jgi:hypothetical protein